MLLGSDSYRMSSRKYQDNTIWNLTQRKMDLERQKEELLVKVNTELAKNESFKEMFNSLKRTNPSLATDPRTEALRQSLNHPLFSVFKNPQQ